MSDHPFNPLDLGNLGTSIANAILTSEATPMANVDVFTGAGIYALYYSGNHPAYTLLTQYNNAHEIERPIYVGKAVPAGGRKGISVTEGTATTTLSRRIKEHRSSLESAHNLSVTDFRVRWLVVESIWIPLGESLMITRFAPVWNGVVDGFGNHDPGAGRINGMISRWDVMHPGRPWANKFPERKESANEIVAEVQEYLRARLQVPGVDALAPISPPQEPSLAPISLPIEEDDDDLA